MTVSFVQRTFLACLSELMHHLTLDSILSMLTSISSRAQFRPCAVFSLKLQLLKDKEKNSSVFLPCLALFYYTAQKTPLQQSFILSCVQKYYF